MFIKGKCLYKSNIKAKLEKAKEICAYKGSVVLPIKERAMYQFIRELATVRNYDDLFLGLEMNSKSEGVYSDGSVFDKDTHYSFDQNSDRFGLTKCVYLKKGVGYEPREADCNEKRQFLCQWKGN